MTEETPPPLKYGTFNSRMLASMLDVGVVMLIAMPVIDWLMDRLYAPVNGDVLMPLISTTMMSLGTPEQMQNAGKLWQVMKEQHLIDRIVVDNLLQFLIIGAYTLPFWFRYSTTPGKMLLRLVIQDEATGERMTRRQAVMRFFGYAVSGVPFTLGFVWMILDRKKRGFHDLIAGTVVVRKQKKPKT